MQMSLSLIQTDSLRRVGDEEEEEGGVKDEADEPIRSAISGTGVALE